MEDDEDNVEIESSDSPSIHYACSNLSLRIIQNRVRDKYYFTGCNARLMLVYEIDNAIYILDRHINDIKRFGADSLSSLATSSRISSNTLVVSIGETRSFVSLYVFDKLTKVVPNTLSVAYRLADENANKSQIGWVFESEIKHRIENSGVEFSDFLTEQDVVATSGVGEVSRPKKMKIDNSGMSEEFSNEGNAPPKRVEQSFL